jgi:L-cystine uptake protein TcyP (sodium:dicarboxylate symporter family)
MLEFFQLVIIPIIIGIIEVVKRAGLPVKFSPLVSVVLGVIFGIFYVQPLLDGIIVGLMVGLSATGLYSGSKNVFKSGGKEPGKK